MNTIIAVPSKKKLVLDFPTPDDVMTLIPSATLFHANGKEYVALDHGVDEVQVLRNIGYKSVPLPIEHYYHWPARFTPMDHQRHTATFCTQYRRAAVLNAPGTGKSVSVLWASDFLLSVGAIKKVAIIAPLSTLKVVWGKELLHHFTHRSFEIITGARKRRRELLKKPGVEYVIVNHDGFTTTPDDFADCDLIIYDEATALKNPSTGRYKVFAKHVSQHDPRLWLLTGTPISQTPTDVWTLARLIGSPTVPKSFTAFRDMVMQRITTFKWVPRKDALETCKRVLQPSIRYELSECMELPETVHIMRDCELTKSQRTAYEVLQAECALSGDNISAANAAVLLGKMLQLCCGVVYADDGEVVSFDDSGRTGALLELLEEIGDKVIVYAPLRHVQNRLQTLLESKGYDVAVVHGGVSKGDRDQIFYDFQNTDKIQVLLAHPKVASHGLTLTRASSIIWYAPIYSLEMYEQANARIRRLTTAGKTTVFHLAATGFERELYKRLKNHQKVLTDFLDMVRGVNE